MINELILINEIQKLLEDGKVGSHPFIRTSLSAIIPMGMSGYSLNENNKVNGIKIGGNPSEASTQILEIITHLKHLERLVFVTQDGFKLPLGIATLPKLRFINLGGAIFLPEELFNRGLNFSTKRFLGHGKRYSKNRKKILQAFSTFKEFNPNYNIPYFFDDLIKNEVPIKGEPGLIEELKLFCCLSVNTS